MLNRLRIEITGQVQGVGFRPHVYRVACALGLTGWVKNNGSGVLIEIEGIHASQFAIKLQEELPPLAKIHDLKIYSLASCSPLKSQCFEILESDQNEANTIISPDVSICNECLHELFDVQSRFYHYPFLNCTHCGPRLSITKNLPYDRAQTSMDCFKMCSDCEKEYSDPNNRRYHAQPIACAQCGPALSMTLKEIAAHLLQGDIVAIKSLGGYQLVCDARNLETIKKLRHRKNRPSKPFALMMLNRASIKQIANCSEQEEKLLISRERPIVLLHKKNIILHNEIAPELSYLGIMLPCTPLHYLLFHALLSFPKGQTWLQHVNTITLIVTSANPGKIPLIIDDEISESELKLIADKIVSYNRNIVTRVDDSVVRVINNQSIFIRRARGYVPTAIPLVHDVPCTLALGAHLKNTFCVTRGKEAFVSQHIGDIENAATVDFLHETLDHLLKFLNVKPERVACDLHPDFYTTQLAASLMLPLVKVQHHHAHMAAVMAEHHIQEPLLGLALDGYGYGDDGKAWGGELFFLDGFHCQRIGYFSPIPLPGGDRAVCEPWRIAVGILYKLQDYSEIYQRFSTQKHLQSFLQLLQQNIAIPQTSSCGRLFDATSALLGIQHQSHYEGEAAMKLESYVTAPEILTNGWQITDGQFNLLPTLKYLLQCDPIKGANIFHGTLIAGLVDWLEKSSDKYHVKKVVLSGGCFLNKILTEGLTKALRDKNFLAYLPQQLPPNDGGLSLGQAWIAANVNIKSIDENIFA